MKKESFFIQLVSEKANPLMWQSTHLVHTTVKSVITLRNILLALLICLCSGCETTELVRYENVPSQRFYEEKDIEAPYLLNSKFNEVLLTTDFKAAADEETIIWLSAWWKNEDIDVAFVSITLTGAGGETPLLTEQQETSCFPKLDWGITNCELKFIKASEELKRISGGQDMKLRIKVSVKTSEGVVILDVSRKSERYVVYPT